MNCNGKPPINDKVLSNISMENKSIITCAGDEALFSSLVNNLVKAVSDENVEWRRSVSQLPIKKVKLNPRFIPFSVDILPADKNWHLVKQPIFHIYWTECSDVDIYKSTVKDDIDKWLKNLGHNNIQDWMIVLVETYDIKKSNKLLPRTTVLDKIRNDFGSKHGDRCISVINPIKSESRSAESWRGLIVRLRHLTLTAYDKALLRFREIIKEHREKRNQLGWNFCHYFLLQEELAFVLEVLGLYDEALIQYDELDALFTQFVLNSNVGDTAVWLSTFQTPLNNWSGVKLNNTVDHQLRLMLAECKASLLDLRSYLFGRQAAMLLLRNMPWEIAQRCLSFIYNTLSELQILEIQKPEGAVECWAFLCALEVLHACQLSMSNSENNQQVDLCSVHTASLWAVAKDKLESLGKLCGLMPGSEPSSEQLHTVVYLIAGIGDSEPQALGKPTPIDKLKEALSSKEAFKRQYLEHAELAMGTYKHIGRIRSARLIGKDLANFYTELGENQKAVAFLSDALQTYTDEGWLNLAAQTQLELAECYKRMDDVERYTKISAAIASNKSLHITVRNTYFEELFGYMKLLSSQKPLLSELMDCFTILSMEVNVTDKVVQDCIVSIEIIVKSLLPREVKCNLASVSVEEIQKPQVPNNRKKGTKLPIEPQIDLLLKCTIDVKKSIYESLSITMNSFFEEQQDKSLFLAKANPQIVKIPIRRSDSTKHRKPSTNVKCDFNNSLVSDEFIMQPGLNTLIVKRKFEQPGFYKVGQLSLIVENKLEFLSTMLSPRLLFQVAKTQPTVSLNSTRDLLAGLVQNIELIISSGSLRITKNDVLKLRTSRGFTLRCDEAEASGHKEYSINLPECEPFQVAKIPLKVFVDLPPKKESSSIEHKLSIQCPWGTEESIALTFAPPLMSVMKLHTAKQRKYLQIIVTGLNSQLLQLTEPQLASSSSVDVNFKSLNPVAGQKLMIAKDMNVSFMWELEFGKNEKSAIPIKTDFRVKYIPINSNEIDEEACTDDPLHIQDLQKLEENSNVYKCNFDVVDYMTLFTVTSKIEASGGGGDFCRAGSMCHLYLTVTRMLPTSNPTPSPQLMYEVLADQTMWAVCGRTAGIVSLETLEKQSVTLDVMPLTSGYLPLPVVRLSRYIPATESKNDISRKSEVTSGPRLEPFSPGQVYNASKAQQVHVLPTAPSETT